MWAYRFFWLTHSYTQYVSSLITVNDLESIGVCVFGWCRISITQIYGTINMVRNNMCHIYIYGITNKKGLVLYMNMCRFAYHVNAIVQYFSIYILNSYGCLPIPCFIQVLHQL